MHEVVDEMRGGEAGQGKYRHVFSHRCSVVECSLHQATLSNQLVDFGRAARTSQSRFLNTQNVTLCVLPPASLRESLGKIRVWKKIRKSGAASLTVVQQRNYRWHCEI
jgi:hypothetical protein